MSLLSSRPSVINGPVITVVATLVVSFGLVAWQRVDPLTVARFMGQDERPTEMITSGAHLGRPSLTAPRDGDYAFIATQPGTNEPVSFDPCRAIHYVVRPDRSLPNGDALIRDALDRVTSASGLQFVDAGSTDEAPRMDRPNFQPDRYGDRWAPVLIAWSGADEMPRLAGDVVGLTSTQPVRAGDNRLALVSGQVVLDAEQLGDVYRYNGGSAVTVATIAHEVGHLVGLDHVDDPHQLMYPRARPVVSTFGNGDLTGLAALGSAPCYRGL